MKLIYIAGPYTTHDSVKQELNIQAARYIGYTLSQYGLYPVMPTVNTAHFNRANDNLQFWYDGTIELMKRCDAVYVLDGSQDSLGVQEEIKVAKENNIPVYITTTALIRSLSDEMDA